MVKYIKAGPIEAEQFDGSEAMIDKYGMMDVGTMNGSQHSDQIIIPTLTGGVYVIYGDWIATGVKGEHWVIADGIFKQTYKPVKALPQMILDAIKS